MGVDFRSQVQYELLINRYFSFHSGHVMNSRLEHKKAVIKETIENGIRTLEGALVTCKKAQVKQLKKLGRLKS